MIDEVTIRALAHQTLDRKSALLFLLVLYGDVSRGIPPARDPDKLTWRECLLYAKAIGRRTEGVRGLYYEAEKRMRPVLAAQPPTVTIARYEPPEETEPTCNISLQRGHEATDSYDSTAGKVLGIPNLRSRERTC